MPYPKGTIILKPCATCGKTLHPRRFPSGRTESPSMYALRKYCGKTCTDLGLKRGTAKSSVYRRSESHRKSACEKCMATTQLHIHHIDRNPTNNSPENLMTLCNACHARWHAENGIHDWRKQSPCLVCGTKSHAFCLCVKHYKMFKRHGTTSLPTSVQGALLERLASKRGRADQGGRSIPLSRPGQAPASLTDPPA